MQMVYALCVFGVLCAWTQTLIPAGKLKGVVQFAAGIFLTAFLLQCAIQFWQSPWRTSDGGAIQLQQESCSQYGVSDAYAEQIVAHATDGQATCSVLRTQDGAVSAIYIRLPTQDLLHEAAQNLTGTQHKDVITDALCGIYGIERDRIVFYGG